MNDNEIFVGIGGNLASAAWGSPLETCEAALIALEKQGLNIRSRSRWYRTEPLPKSDQAWFVNGAVALAAELDAADLLAALQEIEASMGRRRERRRGRSPTPRTIDLDLLSHGGQIRSGGGLILPHPRLHQRAFVLLPLAEIAPDWRHPVSGKTPAEMLAALAPGQRADVMTDLPAAHRNGLR